MKTTVKVILIIAWIILLGICICNPERLVWKITLSLILCAVTWIGYELSQATDMPEDYEDEAV